MNNISKATVIAAVAIMVAVFAVPMMSDNTDAATDTWDGTTDTSWYNDTSTEFTLKTAEELAGLASIVNEGNQLSGKTIILDSDIDLSGRAWTPIGDAPRVDYSTEIAVFAGKFIGNGHTINGLSSKGYTPTDDSLEDNSTEKLMEYMFGFFGYVYNAEISGLKFTNAELVFEVYEKDGYKYVADSVGVAVAYSQGDSKVSDITVEFGNVKGYDAVGGIVARSYGASITLQNCISKIPVTATLENGGKAGGIIGIISLNTSASTLTNCTSSGAISADFSGGILGYSGDGSKVIENCTSTGQITGTTYAGGITGVGSSIKFTDCEYSGTISGASSSGGILGGSQSTAGDVDISDCNVHDSTITGINSAGGFIGSFLGTALDVEGGAVGKTSLNATSTVKPVAGGIVASIGEEPTVTIDGVSTDDTISMTVGNEDVIINDNTYAGNLSGALIGLIEASINLTISNMEDFGSYEMIAECRIGESITLISCHADNILDWMVVDGNGDNSNPIITLKSTHLAGIQSVRDVITLNADSESSIGTLYAGAYNGYETIDSMVYENSGDNIVTGEVVIGENQTVIMDYVIIANYRIDKNGHYREYNGEIKGTDATSSIRINIGNEYFEAGTYQWNSEKSQWVSAVATLTTAEGTTTSYTTLQAAIEAAESESTITLLDDVTETVTVGTGKTVTIDLNGHTIQNSEEAQQDDIADSERKHTITNEGTLTIQDSVGTGVVDNKAHERTAVFNTGVLTIDGGTFTRSAEIIVSDNQENVNSWYLVYNVGTATINGGLFYTGTLDTKDFGNYSSLIINGYESSEGTLTINNGEFYNAANVIRNANGTVVINDGQFTLDNTVNRWAGGNNLIQAEGATTVNGGTFSALGDGTGILAADASYNRYVFAATGTDDTDLLNGGSFYAEGDKTYVVYNADTGTMSVEAGTYEVSGEAEIFRVNSECADPSVSGGSFNTQIPEDFLADGYNLIQSGDGYSTNYVGTTEDPAVASVNDVNYKTLADAVANAEDGETVLLLQSTDTDRINVRTDITIDLDGNTLSLTGTDSSVGIFIYGTVKICDGTIIDKRSLSKENVDGRIVIATNGDLTLEDVTLQQYDPVLTNLSGGDYNYIVYVQNGGSLVTLGTNTIQSLVQDGNYETYGTVGLVVLGTNGGDVTEVTVNEGTTIDTSGFAMSGNGSRDGTVITIAGGTINSDTVAVYHPQEGDITVSGGTITAPTGLQFTGAGKVTIEGGTITATGEAVDSPYKDPNDGDGAIMDGAALSLVTRGSGYQSEDAEIVVEITGGRLVSENNYAILDYRFLKVDGQWVTGDTTGISESRLTSMDLGGDVVVEGAKGAINDEATDAYSITGGTYSSDESDLAADGYVMVENPDGTFGTVESPVSTEIVIDSDGDSINIETDGESVTIPATPDETFSDVTVTVGFPKGEVTVTGTVSGDVTVAFMELADLQGNDFAFNLVLTGIDPSRTGSVTITIPVDLDADQRIESVTAYSVVNGEEQEENATVSGSSVIITTNHNTPFYVDWVLGTVPSQGGGSGDPSIDDDDSPLPPIIGPGGSGSSSSADDDTVTIVACAAAAVVAALMAVFLIMLYRKD